MMNHHTNQPRPGPACDAMASLVALVVGQKRLPPEDADTLQAHLETCAYCRAELDSYRRLDDALARHFAPPARNPLSPGEMNAIISQSHQPRSEAPTRPARPATIGPRSLPQDREPRKRRRHQLLSALSALAAVLLIAVIGLAIFISHPFSPGTGKPITSTATPSAPVPPISEIPYAPGPKDILSSIYMVSADEGWAVGSSFLGAGARDNLMLHYSGGQWKQVSGGPDNQSLHATYSALSQVVMLSATEGWAVGSYEDNAQQSSAQILHYTGGRWLVQATIPNIGLSGLAMVSASEGWAVGSQGFSQSVLLHYTGGAWKQVPAPGSPLGQISMISSTDGWIVGGAAQTGGATLWHYNGSAWAAVNVPALASVRSIAPVSANDVWAVGFAGASGGASNAQARFAGGGKLAFAHYDGHAWTAVQTPITNQNGSIGSLFMDAPNDGWAVGSVSNPPVTGGNAGGHIVYLHYTGGKWIEVSGPDGDGQLALFMLSPSDGWAVGDNATILHYQNGVWKDALSS
jgi:hypothetical protein